MTRRSKADAAAIHKPQGRDFYCSVASPDGRVKSRDSVTLGDHPRPTALATACANPVAARQNLASDPDGWRTQKAHGVRSSVSRFVRRCAAFRTPPRGQATTSANAWRRKRAKARSAGDGAGRCRRRYGDFCRTQVVMMGAGAAPDGVLGDAARWRSGRIRVGFGNDARFVGASRPLAMRRAQSVALPGGRRQSAAAVMDGIGSISIMTCRSRGVLVSTTACASGSRLDRTFR